MKTRDEAAMEYVNNENNNVCQLENFRDGWDAAIKEVKDILNGWRDAYPTDVFTPLPEYGTKEYNERSDHDSTLVTRASAHMGRHMSLKILEQVSGLT